MQETMKSWVDRKPCSPGQGVSRRNSPFKEVKHWEEELKKRIMGQTLKRENRGMERISRRSTYLLCNT